MVRVAHDIMLRGYRGCAQRQTSRSGTAYALRISRNPLCVSAVGTCRHSSGNSSAQRENRTFVTDVKHRLQLYSQLSKYRLSALVMATTSAGYLGAGGPIDAISLSCACLGTMLASSSANTFNQVIETSNDSRMKRTRSRPLPSGRISRRHALGWGFASGSAGVAVLAAGCNPLTAALGAANLALYAGPYTLSKTRSELNTWVGSVVGAVPPLMGWAAATGGVVAIEPLLMAAYLFTWQFPHFFSLAWLHREDYARGGFAMVPCADPTGSRTARLVTRYSWYLIPIPLVAAALDVTSWMFAVEGTALNAYLLHQAYRFSGDRSKTKAREVFKASLWHLPAMLAFFVFHSRRWVEQEDVQETSLSSLIKRSRTRLKGVCVHEIIQKEEAASFCPVVVAEEAGEEAKKVVGSTKHTKESSAGTP